MPSTYVGGLIWGCEQFFPQITEYSSSPYGARARASEDESMRTIGEPVREGAAPHVLPHKYPDAAYVTDSAGPGAWSSSSQC